MENNKDHCTLNDKELIEMAEATIQDLINTGGGSFTMCVPARPNQDTDLILSEVVNRFVALQAKVDKYEKALRLAGLDAIIEALSSEGKEVEKPIEYMPIHPEDARKPGCPKQFPMHLLNEARALSNHSQSLKRLKERGGLSVVEILAIVRGKPWNYYGALTWEDALKRLNNILNQQH
jgi:hypothetical protein